MKVETGLKGKIALVTGANGGLGKFVTQAFLDAGATVVGTSRKIEQSEFSQPTFTAISGAISNLADAKGLVQQVLGQHGRIDVLAHTVGGFAGGQPIPQIDDSIFQQMLQLNLMATFHLLRAVIPPMRETGNGRIIAIGSRAALEPGANLGAYSASKAAMVALLRTVAEENKDAGLRANVILAGTMDTPANRKSMPEADFSKWVRPERVACLMTFLAGEAGKDINGALIPIYGDA